MGHQIKDTGWVNVATGEADIDIDQADYTSAQALLTVAPETGYPLRDVVVFLDLDKDTTGFAAQHAAQTVLFTVQRKVDGTNWRSENPALHIAISGTNASGQMARLDIGDVGPSEPVRVMVTLSAENAVDVEFPYAVYYGGAAPTITAVAAA